MVVSPVSRHIWTDVVAGPLRTGAEQGVRSLLYQLRHLVPRVSRVFGSTKDFVVFLFLDTLLFSLTSKRSFGAPRVCDIFAPTKDFVIFLFLNTFRILNTESV